MKNVTTATVTSVPAAAIEQLLFVGGRCVTSSWSQGRLAHFSNRLIAAVTVNRGS
ncbi:hypothetical protein [Streptomyces sp. NBC_00459]|uniref:hypothetical protein n=1 Tax=Streptomyces sp. NBC_00459 TaxID=2975749 RepID=UPI002E183C05